MKYKIKIHSSERHLSTKSSCQESVLKHRNNNLKKYTEKVELALSFVFD